MKTSFRDSSLFVALTLAIGAANASGETVCASFKATITSARTGLPVFGIPEVDPGTEITGSFSYDPRAPGEPGSGGTFYAAPGVQITLSIRGVQSRTDPNPEAQTLAELGHILVSDAPQAGGSDRFELDGSLFFDEVVLFSLSLEDATGAALSSEELPRVLDLSRFPSASLEARSLPGDGRSFLFAARISAIALCGPKEAPFKRADTNGDGTLDVADAVGTLTFLFLDGREPPCLKALDANDDGAIDIGDPVYTLLRLFAGGQLIPEPHDRCGQDPTADGLTCDAFAGCR